MGFPIPDTGSVTEDVAVVGGLLTASGDIDYLFFDDSGDWTAETVAGAYGSQLVIDVDGNWIYTATNANAAIQALDDGDTLTEVFNVASTGGASTITITIFGADEPPCFTPGTLIETVDGLVAVEKLVKGDLVRTHDNGFQPIRQVLRRVLRRGVVPEFERYLPVLLKQNCLGQGLPFCDLLVSPHHRILLGSGRASLLLGEDQVLCSAKFLTNTPGVSVQTVDRVEYIHLVFARHEIVFSNGVPSESFMPSAQNRLLGGIDTSAESGAIFGDGPNGPTDAARYVLRGWEAYLLGSPASPPEPRSQPNSPSANPQSSDLKIDIDA
jgi:VCBS repeat-containing protein